MLSELHAYVLDVPPDLAIAAVGRIVGSYMPQRVASSAGGLRFWGAQHRPVGAGRNDLAERVFRWLVEDLTHGDYPDTSRFARAHARRLLTEALTGEWPRFIGDCVVTGLDRNTYPAPLTTEFRSWFVRRCNVHIADTIDAHLGLLPTSWRCAE